MEAEVGRRVKSVKEFLHLFPKPTGNDITIKKSADVSDTVKFIRDKAPEAKWQTQKFAKYIKGKTLDETCSTIWHWLYDHIPYKRDEDGVEQIRSPRRTVYEGSKSGVDCDCYSFFISCTLLSLKIPHKYRITKYERLDGSKPRWQHIYIVVPKDGRLDYELSSRDDYIVIDCVKNYYDDEEPYLEYQDVDATMKLDYLDGIEDGDGLYEVPPLTDLQDLAEVYGEEELGKFGQWVKKAVKNVGKAAAKVGKAAIKVAGSPLRNAFLLAMKINFMGVPKMLRYGYLSVEQGARMGMNQKALAHIKKVISKAEGIYKAAGGDANKMKLAILKGTGNKDGKVPLAGFSGLGEVYTDEDHIINSISGFGELGFAPAAGVGIVTPIFTALAAALKEAKGLFSKGSDASQDFSQSSAATDTAPAESDTIPDTTSITNMNVNAGSGSNQSNSLVPMNQMLPTNRTGTSTQLAPSNETSSDVTNNSSDDSKPDDKPSFFKQATDGVVNFVKDHPVITGVGVAGACFLAYKLFTKNKRSQGLSGIPRKTKKRRKTTKKKKANHKKRAKVKTLVF